MFDTTTGQVFREWTISRDKSCSDSDVQWHRVEEAIDGSKKPEPYPIRGAPSLAAICLSVIAKNVEHLTKDHIEILPPKLTQSIWDFCESRLQQGATTSLHRWKIFSKHMRSLPHGNKAKFHRSSHRVCSRRLLPGLPRYTDPLTSLSTQFICHLTLDLSVRKFCKLFTTSELLCLTDIKNLGVLEITCPNETSVGSSIFTEINDRLIRGWTEKPDAFPLLRVLRIWGSPSVTPVSLAWVSKFPSLVLYDVKASAKHWRSMKTPGTVQHGWEMMREWWVDSGLPCDLRLFLPPEEMGSTVTPRAQDTKLMEDFRELYGYGDSVLTPIADNEPVPRLLDQFCDESFVPVSAMRKRTPPPKHSLLGTNNTPFDVWGYWMYSLIGQLRNDEDLRSLGVELGPRMLYGNLLLPSKPYVSLRIGPDLRISRPEESRMRCMLIRRDLVGGMRRDDGVMGAVMKVDKEKEEKAAMRKRGQRSGRGDNRPFEGGVRGTKRKNMHDLLNQMGGY